MDVNNVNSYLELLLVVMCNIKKKGRITAVLQKYSILLFRMSAPTVSHKHSSEALHRIKKDLNSNYKMTKW